MLSYGIYHDNESLPLFTVYNKKKADRKFDEICENPKKYGVKWEVYMSTNSGIVKRKVVASMEERLKVLKRLEELYPRN